MVWQLFEFVHDPHSFHLSPPPSLECSPSHGPRWLQELRPLSLARQLCHQFALKPWETHLSSLDLFSHLTCQVPCCSNTSWLCQNRGWVTSIQSRESGTQPYKYSIDLTKKLTFKYPTFLLVLRRRTLQGTLRVIAFASALEGADFDAMLFSSAGLI